MKAISIFKYMYKLKLSNKKYVWLKYQYTYTESKIEFQNGKFLVKNIRESDKIFTIILRIIDTLQSAKFSYSLRLW